MQFIVNYTWFVIFGRALVNCNQFKCNENPIFWIKFKSKWGYELGSTCFSNSTPCYFHNDLCLKDNEFVFPVQTKYFVRMSLDSIFERRKRLLNYKFLGSLQIFNRFCVRMRNTSHFFWTVTSIVRETLTSAVFFCLKSCLNYRYLK